MIVRSAAGRKIPHSRVFEGETLTFMEKGSMKATDYLLGRDDQLTPNPELQVTQQIRISDR